ncbi:MAG TPA: ABC transporter permease [Acidobacteriota bacterium]
MNPPSKQERRRARRKHALGVWEGIGIALEAIWGNKLRSFLTVLGNIIAVTSIILVVSIIQGLDAEVTDIFSSQGTDVFSVVRSGIAFSEEEMRANRNNPPLERADAEMLRAEGETFGAVVEQAQRRARVEHGATSLDSVGVAGLSHEYSRTDTYGIEAGRYFSLLEGRRNRAVAVLGAATAEQLFPALPPSGALDKRVRINGIHFTVIGVHAARGSLLGRSQDEFINIPIGAFERIFGRRSIDSIGIRPRGPELMDDALAEARLLMRIRHRLRPGERDDFALTSADTFIDIYRQATTGIYSVLVSVVAMSLVVGGIVIMNIMLMVVTERTREIGIRKAVGASYRAVLWQFLVEAVTLSLVGGVLGLLLGYAAASLVGAYTPLPYTLAVWSVVLALVVVTGVGVVFGIYPASRAAKMDPITALGYET